MIYYQGHDFAQSLWNQNYIDSLIQDLMRKFHDKKLGLTNNIKRGDFVSFCTFLYFWSSISIGL